MVRHMVVAIRGRFSPAVSDPGVGIEALAVQFTARREGVHLTAAAQAPRSTIHPLLGEPCLPFRPGPALVGLLARAANQGQDNNRGRLRASRLFTFFEESAEFSFYEHPNLRQLQSRKSQMCKRGPQLAAQLFLCGFA